MRRNSNLFSMVIDVVKVGKDWFAERENLSRFRSNVASISARAEWSGKTHLPAAVKPQPARAYRPKLARARSIREMAQAYRSSVRLGRTILPSRWRDKSQNQKLAVLIGKRTRHSRSPTTKRIIHGGRYEGHFLFSFGPTTHTPTL